MFRKKETEKNVNYNDLNAAIHLLKEILKIAYILCIIVGIYAITIIFKEWHLKETIIIVLKTISPLFIGWFLAWLFDPIVTYLERKGMRRVFGALLTYVGFVACILLILGSIFPLLSDQINDFVKIIPTVFDSIQGWINNVFMKFDNIPNFDIMATKETIFKNIEAFGTGLTSALPDMIVKIVKSIISGTGTLVVSL